MMKRAAFCSLFIFAGCSSTVETGPAPDVSRAECENLNPLHCMMPWPSSRYLVEDSSTATGFRMQIDPAAMPKNNWGDQADAVPYNRFDGFSPMTSMITVFDGELDTSILPTEYELDKSLLPDSPTVLIDASNGQRVPHFSEINEWEGTDFSKAGFYVRPAIRLFENRTYIVAIRNLVDTAGEPIQPSDYFRILRDGIDSDVDELNARRPAFEEMFATLSEVGVERSTLLEAWTFHTASGQSATSDLVTMRDDAMMRVGDRGISCTVNTVEENPDARGELWRKITGTFTVPLYTVTDQPGTSLMRDDDGRPTFNGMAEAPFTLVIPTAARDRAAMGQSTRWLTYGHGLMGSSNEVSGSFQRQFFNDYPTVGVATDWWGMSEPDTNHVARTLGELGMFPTVPERLTQGVINTLVLTRSFAGVCSELPELQHMNTPVIDTDDRYFLGISQGSIMGTTVASLSQDIERFILNVGGISYPIMIIRSVDFPNYNKVIQAWYPDGKLDTDLMMVMVASFWDLAEPAAFAPHVVKDAFPNTEAKRVLYTIGRYDAQVPNIASDIAGRTMGLKMLEPSPYTPFQMETQSAPADSAYVIYDVGADPVPVGSLAAEADNVAHGGVRRNPAAQQQMDAFMRPDGVIEHFCNGACDPD